MYEIFVNLTCVNWIPVYSEHKSWSQGMFGLDRFRCTSISNCQLNKKDVLFYNITNHNNGTIENLGPELELANVVWYTLIWTLW